MKIQTNDFGAIDINENEIIHFEPGILGFEETTEYVILSQNDSPVLRLQSVRGESPRFIIFESKNILKGYSPRIPAEALRELNAETEEEICLFVIAVVPENLKDMTVNLKSPIAVNLNKRLGTQVVLDGTDYSMRHRIFKKNGGME